MIRRSVLSIAIALAVVAMPLASGLSDEPPTSGEEIVSASTLTRTHMVPPAWPQSAPKGVEGWVLLTFTVLPNGTVADVEVAQANPAGIFEDSAVEALRQWRFEPVERDGKNIAQRAEIRMTYALPK